jgi:hypothetical protein
MNKWTLFAVPILNNFYFFDYIITRIFTMDRGIGDKDVSWFILSIVIELNC